MSAPEPPEQQPIEVLDSSVAVTEMVVTTGPHSSRSVLLVLAIGVAIAALAWSLVGGRPASEDGATGPAAPSEAADDARTAQTTVVRSTTTTSALASGPLLGEPSGLSLFYGGEDPLQRLDLDTGVIDRYGLRAWPLAGVGDELVLTAEGSGSIGWVSLDNPGEQALVWIDARAAGSERPGHLWLLTTDPPTWSLIDVAVNRTIEERVVSEQVSSAHQTGVRQRYLLSGTDLVDTPNGIYQVEGDEYRRVGEGRLHDFNQERALVEQCGATLDDCRLQWFDRTGWEPIDLPVPTLPISSARLLGDGSWVRSMKPDGESSELISIETDQRFELGDTGESLAISPDGRWLAFTLPDVGLSLIDLDEGSLVRRVEVFTQSRDGALLFVEQ